MTIAHRSPDDMPNHVPIQELSLIILRRSPFLQMSRDAIYY